MRAVSLAIFTLLLAVSPALAAGPQISTDYWHWTTRGAWDSPVEHAALYQGQLVITGLFDHVGNKALPTPAAWDGTSWSTLLPVPPGEKPITVFQGDLVVGRTRFDGTSAVELMGGVDFRPSVLAAQGDELVAGGNYFPIGFQACRWDESTGEWVTLGDALTNSSGGPPDLKGLGFWQDGLVMVGDDLDFVGSVPVNGVAYWDGSTWSAMGSPISNDHEVHAVVVYDGQLMVAAWRGIYRWTGTDWERWATVDGGDFHCYSLSVDGDDLLAGGRFSSVEGVAAASIARYDGAQWTPLGGGVLGEVRTIATDGATVYMGGDILAAEGHHAYNLARWDGTAWHHMGEGGLGFNVDTANPVGISVEALLSFDGDVVLAGSITKWGLFDLHNVVRREGDGWADLGAGLEGTPYQLLAYDGDLVAVGDLTASGTTPLLEVARWDGMQWSPMVSSVQGDIVTATTWGADLVVGGAFYEVDGVVTSHLARFDGAAWNALPGLSGAVEAVTEFEGDLVAAGWFLFADGQFVNHVARFDGAQWHAMGAGTGWTATVLSVVDGVLYVGGDFDAAGGQTAHHVAFWDGSEWQPMGEGVDGPVDVIEGHRGLVYVGGNFDNAGGLSQRGLATWDASSLQWVDPGFDVAGTCLALESIDDALHVGGGFSSIEPNDGGAVPSLLYGVVVDEPVTAAPAARQAAIRLEAAIPNPFNPSTVLRFDLPHEAAVQLAVFDLRGRRVATLVDEVRAQGRHRVTWNGTDSAGRKVASGVYLARLRSGSEVSTRKLTLVQ